MTGITNVAGGNVTCAHATGDSAIMAIKASAHDLGMIYRDRRNRYPGRWKFLMAGITYITAGYMRRTLAAGGDPIMAGCTIASKRSVIHHGG